MKLKRNKIKRTILVIAISPMLIGHNADIYKLRTLDLEIQFKHNMRKFKQPVVNTLQLEQFASKKEKRNENTNMAHNPTEKKHFIHRKRNKTALTSDLEDMFSSTSESLGSIISSDGGRVDAFFSSVSLSILTLPILS